MSVTIHFDVEECDPDGADIDGVLRLIEMSTAELEDRIVNGFMNLLGSREPEDTAQLDAMMFDGEDHLLVIHNPEVKNIAVIEDTDEDKSADQATDISGDAG